MAASSRSDRARCKAAYRAGMVTSTVFQDQITMSLFRRDIFLLIDDCYGDKHRFAVSYDRQISDITDRKKPESMVQI